MADPYWKKKFSDSARNIAFNLTVSRNQCRALLRIDAANRLRKEENTIIIDVLDDGYYPATALERKGLIKHNGNNYEITKAGQLVMQLLELAFTKKELDDLCQIRKIKLTQIPFPKTLKDSKNA